MGIASEPGPGANDCVTNDTTPQLALPSSEELYGLNSAVAALDANGDPVTPDSIAGWGTDTLTITFSTPLTVDGVYL